MIESALAALRAGRPIVVADDFDRENEGDLILAAELATPAEIGFIVRHTSGVLCVALTAQECLRLDLPPMTDRNEDPKGTAYTVSVDAREGVTTGISAGDRAKTIKMLAQPTTLPSDLTRPGHVFPLRAVDGGTSVRRGHTEAAVDLMRLAGLRPAGVIAELVDDSGEMLRGNALRQFAIEHDLPMLTMDEVVEAASQLERERSTSVVREVQTSLPTEHGRFIVTAYRSTGGAEHLALHMGDLAIEGEAAPLVRLHSECLTGDALGSRRCDCGAQLDLALSRIAQEGRGVVIYLRGHEGRAIGLVNKMHAYRLQDEGADTVDANVALGLPVDAREWNEAADILADLGVGHVRLMSNNPLKVEGLTAFGIEVSREAHQVPATSEAQEYLRTKATRFHHDLILQGVKP
jgi:3,4-dihydroxy 2-butanone 4-phosphate synthase / GTP cyclohydrolase II